MSTTGEQRSERRHWPNGTPRRSFRRWLRHSRPLLWSLDNWAQGYQFRPIKRCRKCDHTSPHHYLTCIHVATTSRGPDVEADRG